MARGVAPALLLLVAAVAAAGALLPAAASADCMDYCHQDCIKMAEEHHKDPDELECDKACKVACPLSFFLGSGGKVDDLKQPNAAALTAGRGKSPALRICLLHLVLVLLCY